MEYEIHRVSLMFNYRLFKAGLPPVRQAVLPNVCI
jgi:hypothetical protein